MYKRAQKGIGYLPQEASVFRKMTVEDNILSVLEMTNFPKEYQKDIFLKFWKAPQTGSMIYDGAGLGLAIVKLIVDLLNGEISLMSEVGKGSVFSVRFPVTRC